MVESEAGPSCAIEGAQAIAGTTKLYDCRPKSVDSAEII